MHTRVSFTAPMSTHQPPQPGYVHPRVSTPPPVGSQQPARTATVRVRASTQGAASSAAPTNHLQQAATSDGICKIMQRQNDITEMLVKHQRMSQLPRRDVPIFYGEPLSYHSFIRAFEQTIESKTANEQDRLLYLQQFTCRDPCDLVLSCEHIRPDDGYSTMGTS